LNLFKLSTLVLLSTLTACAGSDRTLTTATNTTVPANPNQVLPQVVTELTALHRSGQTFLVWPESGGANYHVYRHSAPLTQENLGSAQRLTGRWGPLDNNTSRNTYGSGAEPDNFVVEDLGSPLADNTGLFVHTVQPGQQGTAYYGVTVVTGNDTETLVARNTLDTPVTESVATPRPVLIASKNNGLGRLYTHYMDYQNWNPTLNGYAFSYSVALPANYDASRSYPLQLNLHAFGEDMKFLSQTEFEDWEIIQLFAHDPGEQKGTIHTWWFGHAADHNYTRGQVPSSGTVANFTEQRLMAAVRAVISDSVFNVNTDLIHVIGNSMGASGALSLGLRYPNVISGIYASQPMTDYPASPTFQSNFIQLWGQQPSALQVVNSGPDSEIIQRYGAGGNVPTTAWRWMDHLDQVRSRSSDGFAFLAIDHGKADTTIDWQTQGSPLVAALTDANAGFTANALAGVGHGWQAFAGVVKPLFGLGFGDEAPWRYPRSLSYPSITNASGSGAINPTTNGNDSYNLNIEWSTPRNAFADGIVDNGNSYEITLRSTAGAQTANITPRRTNAFRPGNGAQCQWSATDNATGQSLQTGTSTANGGSVTAFGVPVNASQGTRLRISC
jgi:pimeloyl-ACP methyl ester carboxylesterase